MTGMHCSATSAAPRFVAATASQPETGGPVEGRWPGTGGSPGTVYSGVTDATESADVVTRRETRSGGPTTENVDPPVEGRWPGEVDPPVRGRWPGDVPPPGAAVSEQASGNEHPNSDGTPGRGDKKKSGAATADVVAARTDDAAPTREKKKSGGTGGGGGGTAPQAL